MSYGFTIDGRDRSELVALVKKLEPEAVFAESSCITRGYVLLDFERSTVSFAICPHESVSESIVDEGLALLRALAAEGLTIIDSQLARVIDPGNANDVRKVRANYRRVNARACAR